MADDRRRTGSSSESSSERSLPLSQEEVDALLAGAMAAPAEPDPAEPAPAASAPVSPDADAGAEPAEVAPAAAGEASAEAPPAEAAADATAPDPASEAADAGVAAGKDAPGAESDSAAPGTADESAPLTEEAIARLFAEAQAQTSPAPAPAVDPATPAAPSDRPARFANVGDPPVAPRAVDDAAGESVGGRDLLADVILTISAEIGRSEMTIEEVLKLGPGSLIELDKLAGDPVELLVNDRTIARGEVVVVDDSFGVRIIELGESHG